MVDTSAWIDFFRGDEAAVGRIDPLLKDGRVAICGPVYAELLSGARTRAEFEKLRSLLSALDWLFEPDHPWDRVAEARFALARGGFQASLVDVLISLTALDSRHSVLTRDTDFDHISRILPIERAVF